MKERDRLVLMGVVVALLLVVGWMLFVKPENKRASDLATQIAAAQSNVSTAQSQAASAAESKRRYAAAYTEMVNVGKAVPAGNDVAALMYQLNGAADVHDVTFDSITASAANGATSSSTPATPSTNGAPTSFTALPFTLSFDGSFFDLYQLLNRLNRFVVASPNGALTVDGRLLTITSATLAVGNSTPGGSASATGGQLTGTITADAYVLPSQTTAPGSTATPAAAAPGGSTPTTGSSAAPAVITPGR